MQKKNLDVVIYELFYFQLVLLIAVYPLLCYTVVKKCESEYIFDFLHPTDEQTILIDNISNRQEVNHLIASKKFPAII